MSGSYSRLGRQMRFNETLLEMIVDGFTPDDWATKLGEGNSPHWILGHVASSRRHLARQLGAEIPEDEWEASFGAGVDATKLDPAALLPVVDLVIDLQARGDDLQRLLDGLTDEAAAAPWTKFPDGSSSLGEGAHFMFMHETYHIGQIGLVRRAVGRPGFV